MASVGKIALWAASYAVLDLLFPLVTLFRPCVGVGLAALFILGPRAWPCVALGALASGLALDHSWLEVGLSVVVDTTQAMLAWLLVRRFMAFPITLFRTADLFLFHLLIGPLAMGIGTLLGVGARWAFSLPLPYPLPLTLFYGWMGQSFGAALLTSTVMSLVFKDPPWKGRRISVALPILVLLGMTFYARWLVDLRVRALDTLTLSQHADELAHELLRELRICDSTLWASTSFFGASEDVSSVEFERFVRSLVREKTRPVTLLWFPANAEHPTLQYFDPQSDRSVSSLLAQRGALPHKADVAVDASGVSYYILTRPTRDAQGQVTGRVAAAFGLQALARAALDNTLKNPEVDLALSLHDADAPLVSTSPSVLGRHKMGQRYDLGGLTWSVDAVKTSAEQPRLGILGGLVMVLALQLSFIRLSGQTARIEMLKHDIESRAEALRQLNTELEAAVETARRADQAKSLFLANISHEIRTPMNGILGLTRIVLDSPLGPAQKEQLRHVELSAQNLLALFDNLLDISKLESGSSTLDPRPHHLSTLLEETARQLGPQAEVKGVELVISTDHQVPERLVVDGLKLRQILLNLLSNALKFTPQRGDVELAVATVSRQDASAVLRFSVRDSGKGIASDQLTKIFDPFVQAEGVRVAEGSGLGLAISRSLVQQLGGSLKAQSLPGVGSTFSFEIACPFSLADPTALVEPGLAVHTRMRHRRSQAVVEECVTSWGYLLTEEPSDAALVIVDGLDAITALRPGQSAVVILSVAELRGWFEGCRERGAVPLVRPFAPFSLHDAIRRALLSGGEEDETSPVSHAGRAYAGRRALVVDDNLTNRLLATLLLQRMGFSVDSVEDGENALHVASNQAYDLVLLDLRLPGLDGYEVAQRLREQGHGMPVIAATAHTQDDHARRAGQSGMNGFLTKPLSESRLHEAVSELVPPNRSLEFDRDRLVRSVGGDVDSARDVVRGFLQEVEKLGEAVSTSRSSQSLALACHTLKGAVDVFAMTTLRARLERLESAAESGKLQQAGAAWTEIEVELGELVQVLQAFLEEGTDATDG